MTIKQHGITIHSKNRKAGSINRSINSKNKSWLFEDKNKINAAIQDTPLVTN